MDERNSRVKQVSEPVELVESHPRIRTVKHPTRLRRIPEATAGSASSTTASTSWFMTIPPADILKWQAWPRSVRATEMTTV